MGKVTKFQVPIWLKMEEVLLKNIEFLWVLEIL